jgi:hypothetical protein
MARSALLSIVLLTAMLAGCAGSQNPGDAGADDPMGDDTGGGPGLATLDATSSVPAPTWAVGQWWEWEVFFDDVTREDTFCSIVVSQSGGTSLLATEKDWASKEEAAFDQPLLGPASASDLSTEGWGGQLRLLSFPLTDGKTWTATMPNIAWDVLLPSETAEIAMTARFDDALQGFRITGTAGGGTILEATYLPSTGWFGELVFHDIDPGQEAIEVGFRAKSTGLNYTGPYFMHEARLLLSVEDLVGFSDVPTEGGQPFTQPPQPAHAFTMADGSLYGIIVAEAVAGGRAVVLTPPQGDSRHIEAVGAPEGGVAQFYDEPGMAGEWRVTTTGAGGFSGAFIELYELTETAATR